MNYERKLFVKEHEDKDEDEQCHSFRSRRWYSHGFKFLSVFLVIVVAISILFF